MQRPQFYEMHNGSKAALPFTVVLLVCCVSLWKGLLNDHNALKRLSAAESH